MSTDAIADFARRGSLWPPAGQATTRVVNLYTPTVVEPIVAELLQEPDVIGKRVAHYEIIELVGQGGMGEVYRARDTKLKRDVALKVLPVELADAARLERFQREAETLARLVHPHIVTLFSVEEADRVRFLTMELIDGRGLDQILSPNGLPLDQIFEVGIAVSDALAAAHANGIVHRDLKPGNVMVAADGRVKVLDFGLAKLIEPAFDSEGITESLGLTRPGAILGTVPYMSPEQMRGGELDHRSDIFSLGIMLFEMATGERPFRGSTSAELISSILRDVPPSLCELKPELPNHLGRVIGRCLAKVPNDRYQTARDIFNELKALRTEVESVQRRSTDEDRAHGLRAGMGLGVLPVDVDTNAPDLVALGRGLTEDLVNGFSRFSYLSVVEASYAGEQASDHRETAQRLGVRYLLSGSLRQSGEKVRLSARVIDALNGRAVWSERFDRDLRELGLFDLQDQLTDRIVASVADSAGVLVRAMTAQLRSRPEEELSGGDWMLLTFASWEQMRPSDHAKMRARLERAVEREPGNSATWACLAQNYLDEYRVGFNARAGSLDRALAAARRAVELDPRNSLAAESLADVYFFRRDMAAFRSAADRALILNPRDATTQAAMGMWLVLSGEYERGFAIARRAAELNPDHPGWYQFAPFFYHYERAEYRHALDAAKRMNMPHFFWSWLMIAAASGQLGLETEARAALACLHDLLADPETDARREAEKFIISEELLDRFLDGLRRAGLAIPDPETPCTAGTPKHAESAEATLERQSRSPRSARGTRRPALVGRVAERATLESRLQAAKTGHGTLVLLGGEPGVGKTRLAMEILEMGRELGMLAVVGHARESEEAPFVTVVELLEDLVRQVPIPDLQSVVEGIVSELARLLPELRQVIPGVPAPIEAPPEQQQRLLFRSVFELLGRVSRRTPIVALVDDVHWADASSLQLLEHVARRLGELPILVVGTYRDVESDLGKDFSGWLATLARQRLAERMPIRTFGEPATSSLLAALGGSEPPAPIVNAIHRNSEGNAFFIEEVFRDLSERGALFDERGRWRKDFDAEGCAVPEGVRLVIGHRLERLGYAARQTLETAAVLGLRFKERILREVLADTVPVVEALEDAVAAQWIHSVDDGPGSAFEFRHALVRETLLGALSAPRRQRLHAEVAEALERVFGDRALKHAPEIAMHLARAGDTSDPDRLLRYLVAAGDRSFEEAAPDEALRYYEAALRQKHECAIGDDAAHAAIMYKRAKTQRARAAWPAATADFQTALDMFETLGDSTQVARICSELGDVLFFANRVIEAAEVTERGLTVLPKEPSAERCRLLARLGCYLTLMNEFDRGDPLLGEAEAMAGSLQDPEVRATVARFRLAQQHRLMNGTKKLRAAIDAVDLAERAGATWELSQSQGLALVAVVYAGRFDLLRRIDATERLAEELGDAGSLMCVQVARTYDHLFHGRVGPAVEQGAPMLASMKRLGGYEHHGHAHLATALYYAGKWDEAREHSATAARNDQRDGWFGLCAAAHVKLLAFLGEKNAVLEMVDAHASEVPEPGSAAPIGRWTWALAIPEALATFGMRQRAAVFYPLLVDVIDRGTVWFYNFGLIEKLAGIAAACAGRWSRAEEHFSTALRQARDLPCWVEEPEVLRWQAWAARCRDRSGDPERVVTLLTEARDVAGRLDMMGHVEWLDRMLR